MCVRNALGTHSHHRVPKWLVRREALTIVFTGLPKGFRGVGRVILHHKAIWRKDCQKRIHTVVNEAKILQNPLCSTDSGYLVDRPPMLRGTPINGAINATAVRMNRSSENFLSLLQPFTVVFNAIFMELISGADLHFKFYVLFSVEASFLAQQNRHTIASGQLPVHSPTRAVLINTKLFIFSSNIWNYFFFDKKKKKNMHSKNIFLSKLAVCLLSVTHTVTIA